MRRLAFYVSAVVAVAILLGAFHSTASRGARYEEDARGCDWFGYLRQAKLFQQHGVVGGLDTAIRDDQTLYLLRVAKSLGADPKRWSHGVAPHCHHYKPRTDRVVTQYPPGTGFVHALFPEGTQARWTLVASGLVVLAALVIVIVRSTALIVPWLAAALGVFCFLGMHRYVFDRSIQPSTALSLLIGGLTVATCVAPASHRRTVLAGALGLLIGFAGSVRLPNILLSVGPLVVLGLATLRRPWREPAGFVLAATIAIGFIPVLVGNTLNAGHPFVTTYPWYDAALPSLALVSEGLQFYFVTRRTDGLYLILAAAMLAVAWLAQLYWRTPGVRSAIVVAAVNLLVGAGYIVSHAQRNGYYLFPYTVATMATAVFCLIVMANAQARMRSLPKLPAAAQIALVVVSLGLAGLLARTVAMPLSQYYTQPKPVLAFGPHSIVWANHATGNISHFLDRQAAVLTFLDSEMQDRMIERIDRDGVPQYVVIDSDEMKAAAERLAQRHDLRLVGTTFGHDTLLITPRPSGNR